MERIFPFLGWLTRYQRADLHGDLTAGLTVAVMLIPQGMAYAMLAGLPPIVGLYASTVPLIAYALMGSSRQLAVGPVAIVSIMVAAGVGELADPGGERYLLLAALLAIMVGVIQFALGVLRGGYLVNFLAHPVISGFTSAAALIIGFSQLKHLLGVPIPRSHHLGTILTGAYQRMADINLLTLALGVASIIALIWLPRKWPKLPASLVVVAATTLSVWLFGLDRFDVQIVGAVPEGLPSLHLPPLDLASVSLLLPMALIISMVGFLESVSVAKALAARRRESIDADQELIGLGLANAAAGLFGGYPVTGGFSRSAVNARAGARTGLASIVTAVVIALSLILLTPLFHYMPKAVLAAIIMVAVFGLIDLHELRHLWRASKPELGLLLFTFAATLSAGIEQGILLGVGASLLMFIVRTTRPHNAILGRLPGTEIYRNVKRFPEAKTVDGLVIIRIDASLYFANVEFLKERIGQILDDPAQRVRSLIIDASSTNYLDSSAETALRDIHRRLRDNGISLRFANAKGPVLDMMKRTGLHQQIGADKFFYLTHQAVEDAVSREGLPVSAAD